MCNFDYDFAPYFDGVLHLLRIHCVAAVKEFILFCRILRTYESSDKISTAILFSFSNMNALSFEKRVMVS